jgi:hypothetical protein
LELANEAKYFLDENHKFSDDLLFKTIVHKIKNSFHFLEKE